MAASFFFYDLETSGVNPRTGRIMQFAGQRTDMELKPIGEPLNVLIKLTPDILPEPDAVLIHGITPQKSISEGLTEAEFLKLFYEQAVQPETIFVGFNNIRFDDEFMRFLHYRNFYDAYEWQWKDGNSRWDLLDVVRTARALRPEGIKWPFAPDGKPTNRLEYLTAINKLDHSQAHDALNDVMATIAVARLVKEKQPELFNHLLDTRKKDKVKAIVESGKPFMYTSGRYPSQFLHTTAAVMIGRPHEQDYILVYDLRFDPEKYLKMDVDELIGAWKWTRDPEVERLPVKTLKYNRCPAIVPGVVKDEATLDRLQLSRKQIADNLAKVTKSGQEFATKLFEAVKKMDEERELDQVAMVDNELTVDERLYEGFVDGADKKVMAAVRQAEPDQLSQMAATFKDQRLKSLLPLYKARNFPRSMNSDERSAWEAFVRRQLFEGAPAARAERYFARLAELAQTKLAPQQHYLLEELQLYGQSLIPSDVAG